MNAIDLLTEDHTRVRNLLSDGEAARDPDAREAVLRDLKAELTAHERVEEEVFYPALVEHPGARELVLEGYEEYGVVDRILGELDGTPVEHERWAATFSVMMENLEHHIEEEEGELFEKARQVLDGEELEALGIRMKQRRHEAIQQEITQA